MTKMERTKIWNFDEIKFNFYSKIKIIMNLKTYHNKKNNLEKYFKISR